MAMFDVRDFGATGSGSTDDTAAIVNCLNYAASVVAANKFQAAIRFPSAQYAVSDGTAGANNQQIMKITGAAASLTLSVTMGGGSAQAATPISYDPANPTTNASSMQSALQALSVIGTNNVTVTYQPDPDWYVFVFAPALGVPVLSGSGTGLTVSVMLGNYSQQALQIAGTFGATFTLNVTIGNPPSTGGGTNTIPVGPVVYSSSPTTTATNIQNQLNAALGAGKAYANYDSAFGQVITFIPSMGSPVITASSPSLSVTITVLQSGAAIVIPNLYGLRLIGDGGALADYDQPNAGAPPFAASSRSALVWNGTANGIMLHLLGCTDVTIENLSFIGANVPNANNAARTGVLFSSNPLNQPAQQGGTRLTCRSVVSTRFKSTVTPAVSGCIQFGMNEDDSGGGTTVHEGCTWANGTNGLLVVSSASVNHALHGCTVAILNIGAWFQQGGNLVWDGVKAEALSVTSGGVTTGGTLLKIGPGTQNPAYYPYYGGGKNAGSFLLRNVRTDPLTGPNITLVDATYATSGTQITIDGWDDTDASPTDPSPALIVGSGSSINLRHSLANRTILAQESSTNVPNAIMPAALRLENLIVPEYTLAAALCPGLTANTKVDLVAERTAIYNILRPDRSTIAGRPGYSPVDFLIEQQKPKYFYPLGDIGLLAPNLGWNLYISPTVPRSDGRYAGSMYAQNVQGIVLTDAVGGFNSQGNGYMILPSGGLSFGQITGQNWTLFVIAVRSSAAGAQMIVSNLSASTGGGGFQLQFDASGHVVFTTDNGSTRFVVPGGTANGVGTPVYILVQVVPNSAIKVYLNGSATADGTQTITTGMTYMDNGVVPVIAATPGTTPTPSNVQVARLATCDLLVSLAAWANIFNYGSSFQGR